MSPPRANGPDWRSIDTVLLDLDGTLLDLAFDNWFWLELIPATYAARRCLRAEDARSELLPRFRACEGRLDWYCIEHWSRELDLDIAALKRRAAERIVWLPGAPQFLRRVRAAGKRLVLLTNAHPETLRIKDERTGVIAYFDAAFSSHAFGAPKEDPRFWEAVQRAEAFDRDRALFVDDSPAVLRAARAARIRWIYAVRRPDSAALARAHEEFDAVDSVVELGEGLGEGGLREGGLRPPSGCRP